MKPWCTIISLFLVTTLRASVDVPLAAFRYVQDHAGDFQTRKADVQELRLSSRSTGLTGVEYVYLQQQKNGIDIYNAIATIAFSPSHTIIHATGRLVDSLDVRLHWPEDQMDAVAVLERMLPASSGIIPSFQLIGSAKKRIHLGQNYTDSVSIRRVWWSQDMGPAFDLVYEVVAPTPQDIRQYIIRVADGSLLQDRSLYAECGFEGNGHLEQAALPFREQQWFQPFSEMNVYNVYPLTVESPAHGVRTLVVNPADPVASPFGWHDVDGNPGAEFKDTEGNNARVQEDTDGDDLSGKTADGGDDLVFDFSLNEQIAPIDNLDAVLTNLFFWVNLDHDIFYHNGFKESNGNFQQNNYGRTGVGNDPVVADAMDGSGYNNARFYSPEDGTPGRMEMFLWGTNEAHLEIKGPDPLNGILYSVESDFSKNNKLEEVGEVSAPLVLLKDVGSPTYEGCLGTGVQNEDEFAGKIVLIERGTCFFIEKVYRVQELGAVAAIVFNNDANDPIVMGGNDNRINIPAVMISRYDGLNLVEGLLNGDSLNATLSKGNENKYLDSSLDNLIITHEYGHGVSIRLAGGPAITTCLDNEEQMGEGWSDYFGLLLTTDWTTAQPENKRGVGTWLSRERTDGRGIRPYPYSYSLSINPLNYGNINTLAVPHGVGSVWCSMLWDMTWEMVALEGASNDWVHGDAGNNKALKLVIEALKLQPCLPGFVDGRDAILKADEMLYGGRHQYAIWKAFARRGLGAKALENSPFTTLDGVANFDLPDNFKTNIDELIALDSINQVNVTWNTLAEFGNAHFLLERKTGNGTYTEIARIPGLAFDLEGRAFRVPDQDVKTGNHYTYRLSAVNDFNKTTVLGIAEVYLIPVVDLVTYPNPVVNGSIQIKIATTIREPVEVNLYGVDGRRHFHQEFSDPSQLYTAYSLPVDRLNSGTYFVQLVYAGEAVTKKIQIIR